MENLAPPVDLLIEIRFGIEKGQSVRASLLKYLGSKDLSDWAIEVRLWLNLLELGRPTGHVTAKMPISRRQVLDVIERGLRGESILPLVLSLETELIQAMNLEIEEFAAKLPIKSMIPLLFFQFPAFLLLLLGPFLTQFLNQS